MYTGDDFNYAELIAGDAARPLATRCSASSTRSRRRRRAALVGARRGRPRALPRDPRADGAAVAPHLPGADALLQDRRRLPGLAERPPVALHDGRRAAERALARASRRRVPPRRRAPGCSRDPDSRGRAHAQLLALHGIVAERDARLARPDRCSRSTPRRCAAQWELREIIAGVRAPRHPRHLAVARPGRGASALERDRAARSATHGLDGLRATAAAACSRRPTARAAQRRARRQPARDRRGAGARRALPGARRRRPAGRTRRARSRRGPRRARGRCATASARLLEYARAAGVPLAIEPLHPMYAADRACVNTLGAGARPLRRARRATTARRSASPSTSITCGGTRSSRRRSRAPAGTSACSPSTSATGWCRRRDLLIDRGMMGDGVIDLPRIRALDGGRRLPRLARGRDLLARLVGGAIRTRCSRPASSGIAAQLTRLRRSRHRRPMSEPLAPPPPLRCRRSTPAARRCSRSASACPSSRGSPGPGRSRACSRRSARSTRCSPIRGADSRRASPPSRPRSRCCCFPRGSGRLTAHPHAALALGVLLAFPAGLVPMTFPYLSIVARLVPLVVIVVATTPLPAGHVLGGYVAGTAFATLATLVEALFRPAAAGSQPVEELRRMWRGDRNGIDYAVAYAAALALALAAAYGLSATRPFWAAVAVLFVMHPDRGEAMTRIGRRIGGTFAGVAVAWAVWRLRRRAGWSRSPPSSPRRRSRGRWVAASSRRRHRRPHSCCSSSTSASACTGRIARCSRRGSSTPSSAPPRWRSPRSRSTAGDGPGASRAGTSRRAE